MKYIRTKDGIYKVLIADILGSLTRIDKRDGTYPDISNENITAQADTIEELCDEYVRIHKTVNNRSMICDKELAVSSSKYPKCYDVYGAIWTDKGLIYVAKMNEKGELELL